MWANWPELVCLNSSPRTENEPTHSEFHSCHVPRHGLSALRQRSPCVDAVSEAQRQHVCLVQPQLQPPPPPAHFIAILYNTRLDEHSLSGAGRTCAPRRRRAKWTCGARVGSASRTRCASGAAAARPARTACRDRRPASGAARSRTGAFCDCCSLYSVTLTQYVQSDIGLNWTVPYRQCFSHSKMLIFIGETQFLLFGLLFRCANVNV